VGEGVLPSSQRLDVSAAVGAPFSSVAVTTSSGGALAQCVAGGGAFLPAALNVAVNSAALNVWNLLWIGRDSGRGQQSPLCRFP